MFKSKRRKELEARERELLWLQQKIDEMKWWCAADSPEIGHAMLQPGLATLLLGFATRMPGPAAPFNVAIM